jgi:hypothetical protein
VKGASPEWTEYAVFLLGLRRGKTTLSREFAARHHAE